MRRFQKKGFPILLASTLMFTSGVLPSYAQDVATTKPAPAPVAVQDSKAMASAKISKDQALEIAKQTIPIPDGFTQRNIEFQSNWWGNQTAAWIVYWDKQTPPNYGHIHIVIDANDGHVLQVEMYNGENTKSTYPPKVDITKAKDIAMEYIQKNFPDKAKEIVYDDRYEQAAKPPLNGHVEYPITYKRQVNGIPFENNEIRINVNGDGKVVNIGYRWDDAIQFPSFDKLITKEQALKVYQEKVNLAVKQLSLWGPGVARTMKLGYMPDNTSYYYEPIYIRATDGSQVTLWGDEVKTGDVGRVVLSDKKLGELNHGKVTQEKAMEILKAHFELPKDENMIRASFREQWGETQTSVWEFNWEIRNEGMMNSWAMAAVDAKTGRILNYSNERHVIMEKEGVQQDQKTKITKEQAEKKAIELMKALHPDIAHQLYLMKMPRMPHEEVYNGRFQSFTFMREVNGISLEHGGIHVNVDMMTGEVGNYWFNADNLLISENKKKVMSPGEALEAYVARLDMPLVYVLPNEKPSLVPGAVKRNLEAMLVYQPRVKEFGEPVYLDAETGKWTHRETGQLVVESGSVTDIRGHRAEKELQLLLRYNVFDVENKQIKPDEEISRGEMIKMLVLLENNGYKVWYDEARSSTFKDVQKSSPYFAYIENAVERNWIDRNQENFKPDEKINREEMATMIIRALGFEHLAKIDNLFINDLQDADSIKAVGAAILISKLGIMETQEGKFIPQGTVTRADAAVAFSRYLSKRNELRY
ncbi:YcdB/YcdC domain-containing protein [Ammoniphilus sp. CFH 90114]|uniref:YcdB/YcdC domain-containing protein n=1 Tax=Ammoniphilus sp. CFH 90114 TaxID=2493665 RepID=UPI0013E929C2|nr:YcdB/YcdC domain-containing protein [Ammoniphilus sp. CFH 90114]